MLGALPHGRSRVRALFGCLALLAGGLASAAAPHAGPWYDRAHDGHGFDIQRAGGGWFIGVYTYDAAGEPEWFVAQGAATGDAIDIPLYRFGNAGTSARPDARAQRVGTLAIRVDASAVAARCADGVDRRGAPRLAALDLRIGSETHAWCIEPLLPPPTGTGRVMDGIWWAGEADAGWGLTTHFAPGGPAIAALYHYDAAGRPRWVIAERAWSRFEVDARWQSLRGYCRGCTPVPRLARDAGTLSLRLVSPRSDGRAPNRLQADVVTAAGAPLWPRDVALRRFSDDAPRPGVAATADGVVEGFADGGDTLNWRGIPYAAPPVGALRWAPPRAAEPRSVVLATHAFGAACPQPGDAGGIGALPQSEDCLTLNVWAPADAATPRPVLVWLHGGAHFLGSAARPGDTRPLYDGAQYARRGIVFVSVQYRLGALGYAVLREFADAARGNLGLRDQLAALRWVAANIDAFGGDPARITLAGESAGGSAACALLAAPTARGLVARALIQSGDCPLDLPHALDDRPGFEAAVRAGDRLRGRLGCAAGDASCLRAAGVAAILDAQDASTGFDAGGERYGEVLDDDLLPLPPGRALRDPGTPAVPLLVGSNADDATALIPVAQRPSTAQDYAARVVARHGANAGAILAAYPGDPALPPWRHWAAVLTDEAFVCPAQRIARDVAAHGVPVHAYQLLQVVPGREELGAYHELDLFLAFDDFATGSDDMRSLAATVKALWSGWVREGVPRADGVPAWPLHPAVGTRSLDLAAGAYAVREGWRAPQCALWDAIAGP
jgi:para-nitrobenzyl esterase